MPSGPAFSLDFCLEGFRLIRQRPKLIAFWGIVTLFGNGVGIGLAVALAGPALQNLILALTGDAPTPEVLAGLMQSAMPGIAIALIMSAVAGSVVTAAICRVVAGGTDDRLGFLQFGTTELRLIFVNLIMLALTVAIIVACFILASVPAAIFMAVPGAMQAFAALAFMLSVGIGFWLHVRLSLNLAQSFDSGRIDMFGSFALTRGYFRKLASGYLIAFALGVFVQLMASQVMAAILTFVFGTPGKPDLANLTAFLTPVNVLDLVLSYGIISPMVSAILYGAPVAAYARLTDKTDRLEAERVF